MRKYIAELIGTFALIFCGTGAIVINQETHGSVTHAGIAITFGLIVMAMIFSLGKISGAHLNPAVTIAFTMDRRFELNQVLPYILSQLAGGFLASALLKFLFPLNTTLGGTVPLGSEMQSFVLELILTFLLMLVILSVAKGSKEDGMLAGIAIGSTVLLEAMFAGPVSGASMNPARSITPAIISAHTEHIWIYIFAPIIGASLAVPVFKLLNPSNLSHENSPVQ